MAKLVEILARAFIHWPEGANSVIYGDCGSTAYFDMGIGYRDCIYLDELEQSQLGDGIHVVTRAEWQAAVDALKADDCAHSYGSEDGCPECGATKPYSSLNDQEISRVTRSAARDGAGLPPVGTICENVFPGEIWREVIIIAHDGDMAVFRLNNSERLNYFGDTKQHFRPIRTPEQIAAEERDKAIHEMCRITESHIRSTMGDAFRKIYDAGYRKQEPK